MHLMHYCMHVSICALSLLSPVLQLSPPAAAQDSWMGKKIMPKTGVVDIRSGNEVIGKSRTAVLTVLNVDGDWLRVRDHGVEGWIARSAAVLLDDAIEHFTNEIRKDQRAGWAYEQRGIAQRHEGDCDSAIEDFNAAIRIDPNDARAHANRADAWYLKNDYDKAMADYDKAIRLRPEDPYAHGHR